MSRFGRAALTCAAILVGCADTTFDLLPEAAKTGSSETPGSGDVGQSGDAAVGGSAGSAVAAGGKAGRGSGGSGDISQGGAGDEPNGCGLGGCTPPPSCRPENGCFACRTDGDCFDPIGHCDPYQHRCVNCRPLYDCAPSDHCERDCMDGDVCDGATSTCAPECRTKDCPTSYLRVCDAHRFVCVDCAAGDTTGTMGCPHDLKCNYLGQCVDCLGYTDCPDSKPVCNFNFECVPCSRDDECNPPGGPQPGFPERVCYGGRCVTVPTQ